MLKTGQTDLTAARVAKGSIYLTFQNVFSTLIGVSGFALMARMVTTDEMGVIAGLTLLSSLAPLISDFGLNSSILKHVSELKGRSESISDVISSAAIFRTALSVLIASVVFVMSSSISEILFKTTGYSYTIKLLSIDAVLLSISPLLNNTLLGIGRLKERALYGLVSVVTRWAFIVAFLMTKNGLDGIVIGWILGDVVLLSLLTISIARITGLKRQSLQGAKQRILAMLKFAFPLYMSSFVLFIFTWYDKVLLLVYLPLSNLGLYNTVYTAFSILALIATTMGSALIPYYGMAYGKNDHQAIGFGMARASRYTMLLIFPLAMGLLAAAKPTLVLFAGPQYEEGWITLTVLAFFGLTYAITPVLSNILLIYGKTKTILLISLIPVALSLLMIPLIWIMGLTGLAVMRGASLVFSLIFTFYFVDKLAKIKIDKKVLVGTLIASTTMAVVMLILQQLYIGQLVLLISVLTGGITYIALIRIQKILNKDDYELVEDIIGPKLANYFMKIMGYKPIFTQKVLETGRH